MCFAFHLNYVTMFQDLSAGSSERKKKAHKSKTETRFFFEVSSVYLSRLQNSW